MSEPSQPIKQFITNSYQLISASSPTVPLQGSDLSIGLQVLNQLIAHYSANGMLLTVSKQIDYMVSIGQGLITFGDSTYTPTPDITTGRLANLDNAWLSLEGVTYPLIDYSRNAFFNSYKYSPLQGLPRYVMVYPETNITTVQIFPAPSQIYQLSFYGKYQLPLYTSSDQLSNLPSYYVRFLQFALAKDLALYKGRAEAWTDKLEMMYNRLEKDMIATTSQNTEISINQESWLNGAYRIIAGI